MAVKSFCDKCGTEVKGSVISLSLEDPRRIDRKYDLCPACRDELLGWLGKEELVKYPELYGYEAGRAC